MSAKVHLYTQAIDSPFPLEGPYPQTVSSNLPSSLKLLLLGILTEQ